MAVDPRLRSLIESAITKIPITRAVKSVPFLQKMVDEQFSKVLREIEPQMAYLDEIPTFSEIPFEGLDKTLLLTGLEKLAAKENQRWSEGFVSGAVYHGGKDHIAFLNKVYALFSQSNPLHHELWPSIPQFESEIVSMTARMLGAEWTEDEICGNVSSGGTESTLLAMKAYRDWAREERGILNPEVIVPISAHSAFDKGCEYLGIKKVSIPLDEEYQVSIPSVRKAITKNTILLVGSAPSYPHGVIDPIPDLASLGMEKSIPLHVDASLGGFILPWIRDEYAFPPFDFSLKGVSSISVDTHKYGYANKGNSVILYRGKQLRRFQYHISTDWPGGLYASPTIAGSRSGALIAQCWASMVSIGQEVYKQNAITIVDTARMLREGIERIPQLKILGHPLFVIAVASDTLDIFSIMSLMIQKGWYLNGMQKPNGFHFCVTLIHTQNGIAEKFLKDLKDVVLEIEKNPQSQEKIPPLCNLASNMPARDVVGEFMKHYLDSIYG